MSIILIFAFCILCLACIGDLVVPLFLSQSYPDYSHLKDTISTLGTDQSPVQKEESFTLIIVGILFIIFSFIQLSVITSKTSSHYWYYIGLAVYGIGCIFAGLYPEDPKGVEETIAGKIHGIASGIGFLFLIAIVFVSLRFSALDSIHLINLILGILALVTFVLFLISENIAFGFFSYTGLFQRLNLFVLYASLILTNLFTNFIV